MPETAISALVMLFVTVGPFEVTSTFFVLAANGVVQNLPFLGHPGVRRAPACVGQMSTFDLPGCVAKFAAGREWLPGSTKDEKRCAYRWTFQPVIEQHETSVLSSITRTRNLATRVSVSITARRLFP